MFAYEPPLEPPCDHWKEYELPMRCRQRMHEVCMDIIRKHKGTHYQNIYDAIYELVEADIEAENLENCYF